MAQRETYKICFLTCPKGMLSCGAITNILASMLRHVGYKVNLIHGEIPKSVDHAWLAVYNNENKKWEEFDLTSI